MKDEVEFKDAANIIREEEAHFVKVVGEMTRLTQGRIQNLKKEGAQGASFLAHLD